MNKKEATNRFILMLFLAFLAWLFSVLPFVIIDTVLDPCFQVIQVVVPFGQTLYKGGGGMLPPVAVPSSTGRMPKALNFYNTEIYY